MGDILYKLVESGNKAATSVYGCKNGCVYKTEGLSDKICFTTGSLPVSCQTQGGAGGGGWCYEGVCGVDQWPILYPVQYTFQEKKKTAKRNMSSNVCNVYVVSRLL